MLFVLVTGSRSWTDRETVRSVLSELGEFQLLHGGAKGLDTIAGEIFKELTGRDAFVERPDYKSHHWKYAPLARNNKMLDIVEDMKRHGHEVLVIAFKDLNSATGGTNKCYDGAVFRGLPTKFIAKVQSSSY